MIESMSTKLRDLRDHLAEQYDVKSADITKLDDVPCVRAIISNELSGGTMFTRWVYYNVDGTVIGRFTDV